MGWRIGRTTQRISRRAALSAGSALLPALAGCANFGSPQSAPAPGSGSSGGGTPAVPAPLPPTPVPPTPTPAPTPVPEPREYAIEGGWYYAVPGFAVRDEPGGPRFWTEFARPGVLEALGLPTSRAYDAAIDGAPARVQRFRNGWLAGAPGAPAVRRGEGTPPHAPPEALQREDRPEMAFIGRVDVSPKEAKQGTTVLVRVWSTQAQSATVNFEGRDHPLARDGQAWVGLFGVQRLGAVGARPIRFTLTDAAGRRVTRNEAADTIRVVDAGYPTEDLIVDAKTLALLDPVKLAQEDRLMDGVFSRWSEQRYWKGPFAEPMLSAAGPVPLSSDFGVKRSINGAPANWSHEGTDYEVDTGDPIKACADGKVVYVGDLHVRGKVVVIDHGWGVMSGYFHMFQQQVQEGQDVKKGQQIGLVGSTGFVTGPHLHVEIRVRNVYVEPLEWFQREPFLRPDLASL